MGDASADPATDGLVLGTEYVLLFHHAMNGNQVSSLISTAKVDTRPQALLFFSFGLVLLKVQGRIVFLFHAFRGKRNTGGQRKGSQYQAGP